MGQGLADKFFAKLCEKDVDGAAGRGLVHAPARDECGFEGNFRLDQEHVVNYVDAWQFVGEVRGACVVLGRADGDCGQGSQRRIVDVPEVGAGEDCVWLEVGGIKADFKPLLDEDGVELAGEIRCGRAVVDFGGRMGADDYDEFGERGLGLAGIGAWMRIGCVCHGFWDEFMADCGDEGVKP